MILLIDNYDSFTYNLYQQFGKIGASVRVVKNDEISVKEIGRLRPEAIVISPGPGRPKEAGISMKVVEEFYKSIPVLGVCLGHQAIGLNFGSKVVGAKKILHGKTSLIFHNKDSIFKDMKSPFVAARYHSLTIDEVPNDFVLTAWTKDQEIMGIRHKEFPVFGVQFHPESFMTVGGDKIIENFLNVSKKY